MTSETNNNDTDGNHDDTSTNINNHNPPPPPSTSSTSSPFHNEEHQMKMKIKKQAKKQAKQQRIIRRQEKNSKHNPLTTFFGKHKWLGGAVDPMTGIIYGIPAHSYQIICITPSSSNNPKGKISTIPLPNEYQEGHYKWLRGLIYDGYLYGIPAWNVKGILKVAIHPSISSSSSCSSSRVKVLPLPREPCYYRTFGNTNINNDDNDSDGKDEDGENEKDITKESERYTKHSNIDRGRWMWHGGTVGVTKSSDSKNCTGSNEEAQQVETCAIYCIPSNAQHVLKVSLDDSDKVEEIGPSLSEGQNKWYDMKRLYYAERQSFLISSHFHLGNL